MGFSYGFSLGAYTGRRCFLCANRVLVDVANCHTVSFATYPCTLGGPGPLALANILAAGDVYQQLLAEFPALTVPAFSAAVAKHGVEHYITTVGPRFLHAHVTSMQLS